MTLVGRLLGRLGRRYWVERVSRALNRAHEDGYLTSWLLHEIDARIKGYNGIAADKVYDATKAVR